MAQKRLKTWQKASALLPLALLSGAWTTSLAATGSTTAAEQATTTLPDGTVVPTEAIEAPASVTLPGVVAPGIEDGTADSVVASSSANGIPSAALAAYQRAAQVINSADRSCQVSWQLIAAIGRVESDHGRYGGNVLNDDGKSTPGIYGIPLDGTNGTAEIRDTDAGQYDDDKVFDRAIGPMQFIPSTWSVVGVDADGDGNRNPQDIGDAALASAVYLCSGKEDLSTTAGQREAVYRYNNSDEYVDLVLSIMDAYMTGDYTSIPNGTVSSTVFAPMPSTAGINAGEKPGKKKNNKGDNNRPNAGGDGGGNSGGGTGSTGGSGGSGGGSGSGDDGGSTPAVPGTGGGGGDTKDPVDKVKDTVEDIPDKVKEPVEKVLITSSQAAAMCTSALNSAYGAAPQQAVTKCANQLMGKTVPEAQAAVGGIVAGLASLVDGLIGGLGGGGGGGLLP